MLISNSRYWVMNNKVLYMIEINRSVHRCVCQLCICHSNSKISVNRAALTFPTCCGSSKPFSQSHTASVAFFFQTPWSPHAADLSILIPDPSLSILSQSPVKLPDWHQWHYKIERLIRTKCSLPIPLPPSALQQWLNEHGRRPDAIKIHVMLWCAFTVGLFNPFRPEKKKYPKS